MKSSLRIFILSLVVLVLCSLNVEAAVNKVFGGAYIYPETPAYRATFSMDVSQAAGESPSGLLKYYYTKTRLNLVSTGITSLAVSGNTATIGGTGTVNGVGGYTFTASVTDEISDTFAIKIFKSGAVYHSAGPKSVAMGDITVTANQLPLRKQERIRTFGSMTSSISMAARAVTLMAIRLPINGYLPRCQQGAPPIWIMRTPSRQPSFPINPATILSALSSATA